MARRAAYAGVAATRRYRPEDALVIISDPRGGSTWLTELLEESTGAAVSWEPLTLGEVPEVRRLGFTRRQYIPENGSWPEAERLMDRILSGRLLSPFICSHSGLQSFIAADRLLVKFCRAQALLPWLTARYRFQRPPVHFLRHPFAVAASQMAHGAWTWAELRFSVVDGRFGEEFAHHRPYLERLETLEEALVATWCMANSIPLRHPRKGRDWVVVHYEELLMEPARVLPELFSTLRLPLPGTAIEAASQPSRTTKDARFTESRSAQLEKWRESFSADQIERMQAVLDHFEIVEYSGQHPMPAAAGGLGSA